MTRSALLLLLAATAAGSAATRVVPVINEIETWREVGQPPYEMTWGQRNQDPRVLVDFEDLRGWTLELFDGTEGELRRSREQQLWGQHVAKFQYRTTAAEGRLIARPPKPIPIRERFDCVELWGYGNRWAWVKDVTTPAADVYVLIVDAASREHRVNLTDIRWKQWWLIHRKLPAEIAGKIAWPASFSGIEIAGVRHKENRNFYCDSLVFFTEELKPLVYKPQPRRNLKPFRGQIVGTNTGDGVLPFPTREETILPSNFESEFKTSVRQTANNRFEFRYQGRDAAVVFEYVPAAGALSEITASVNGGPRMKPMDGGGIRFANTPEGRVAEGELISARLAGDKVEASFRFGSERVDYELQLRQKSLMVDAWCDSGQAAGISFGRVSGVVRPRLITIPYITYGGTNPRVLLSEGGGAPVFTSIWFDWYRTNASEVYYTKQPQLTATSAEINGGLKYIAKTDGKRNNLADRIFVTVSPVYEEVLPTIANPVSLRREEGREVVWTVTSPRTFQEDHQRSRKIRSYGLDKIMQHSHEVTWRDEGESFTMRLKPAPQKGGEAGLKWYIQAQNSLGWLQGVYSNYTDFAPVNTNWNPDYVTRLPDGEWQRAWPRNYKLKPSRSVEMDEYYAARIKEKYGVKMSYTDVHTCLPPWAADYDARVPGAGTMAANFYAYGQLLLNDQRVYGPSQSEATYQWMYAGLASGNYGWVYTDVNLLTVPVDVAFMLHKIHPLECEYGMGYTHYYLDRIDPKWKESPKRREYVDLFLATTVAYGNMGWLVNDFGLEEPFGIEALARSYYMMQQLQQQYAFARPARIEYADASGRMLAPSQAHATGAITGSRLHVVYDNGTQVFVNRSTDGVWSVKDHRGNTVELPVSGWLVFNAANGFYETSANASGRRIDHVAARDYEFLDGRGAWTRRGRLGATGSVALREKGSGKLDLIDIYGNDRIAFQSAAGGSLAAFDPDGKALGAVELTSPEASWREFKPVTGARSYVFTPGAK